MVTLTNRPDIGDYRKIRLKPNAKGYYEIWWTDAAAGYLTRRQSKLQRTRLRRRGISMLSVPTPGAKPKR